ncbi:MAG: hypothetical protein ABI725_00345 [Chloroflexota bacterium]
MAGLALVATASLAGRANQPWAEAALFGGFLLLMVPIALRLVAESPTRAERAALVCLLGLALFVMKLLRGPLGVSDYDEFLHWRTAQDIVSSGTLFSPNSLLGVSPYYPGLELVTTALSQMAGIPIFEAGVITLAAARLTFMLALFFFFEVASGDARVAGLAALIYMLNPKFLYFDSQFAYESLALPFAALVLYLLARRGHSGPSRWLGLTVIIMVTLPAVVVTHHVTSMMLAAFLVLWALVALIMRRRDRHQPKPGRIALFEIALIAGWTLTVATATISYLGPAITSTLTELIRLIGGQLEPRELFVARSGAVAPLWERLVGSGSAAVIIAFLPLGLLVVWSRFRNSSVMVALALVAAAYPASLLARFTSVGAEVATRTPEFLFLGIGAVVALGLARFSYRGRFKRPVQLGLVALFVAVIGVGSVIVGVPTWVRLPGPYLVSADFRSIEPQGISAATWAYDILGPGNRIAADRINRILMATYGHQTVVTSYETGFPIRRLYLEPEIGPAHRRIIAEGRVKYLLVDRRMTTAPPAVGVYIDRGEEAFISHDTALDPEFLDKFDRLAGVHRIFDSGDIQIYDISALAAPAP